MAYVIQSIILKNVSLMEETAVCATAATVGIIAMKSGAIVLKPLRSNAQVDV